MSCASGEPAFPSRVRGPIALTHVAIATMESRSILRDQTVIIENGIIRDLGPSKGFDIRNTPVIECSDKYLMPGLADMHTHITDGSQFGIYLANGVTQVRNMEGLPFHLALAQLVERGKLPGPRIFTSSPLIDGLGAQGLTARPRSLVLEDPAQAEAMVRQIVKRGYREIKAYQWLKLEALKALGRAAARAKIRMAGHCPEGITFEQAIAAGMGCFEHLTGIGTGHLREGRNFPSLRDYLSRHGSYESLELLANHLDFDAIRRLAQTMASKQIWNCPTLVVWQKQNQNPDEALADPNLNYEHRAVVRSWAANLKNRLTALPCCERDWLALARRRDQVLAKVVKILHQEGAPLLVGTDAPNPFVVPGPSIHQELANLVEAGLSAYEALRCATIEAARFLGESAFSGSVAIGKRADLVLLGENPLEDVRAVRNLEAVFVNGYYLTRAHLDSLVEQHLKWLAEPVSIQVPEFETAEKGERVKLGRLIESFSDSRTGLAGYQHSRLPDGSWNVEEVLRRCGPRGPLRRCAKLHLNADLTLHSADIEVETFVGQEKSEIVRTGEGSYSVCIKAADGQVSNLTVRSPTLLPSERVAFSVLPLWLSLQSSRVAMSLLDLEYEVAQIAAVEAEPLPSVADEPKLEIDWMLKVKRPGELSSQKYRISDDGGLLGLADTLFGGERSLVSKVLPAVVRS